MRQLVLASGVIAFSIASSASAADQALNDKLRHDVTSHDLKAVESDIAAGADVNAQSNDKFKIAVLEDAADGGDADIVRTLLEHGANPNLADGIGETVLMSAAFRGNLDLVRMLIEHGADPNLKDQEGKTALMNAASENHADVALLLLEHGADVNAKDNSGTPVIAVYGAKPDMVTLLRAHGATAKSSDEQRLALKLATDAGQGDVQAVQQDLAGGADVNSKDMFGQTPLNVAAEHGQLDLARFLVEHGADVNAVDNAGASPLMRAVIGQRVEIVRLLLDHGASVTPRMLSMSGADVGSQSEMAVILRAHQSGGSAGAAAAAAAPPPVLPVDTRKKVAVSGFIPSYNGNLRVGYHADLPLIADCPASWDKHGEPQGTGDWGATATLVDGQLPPGLTFHQGSGTIDGTPRQPGDWQITVHLDGLHCYTKDNQEIDMDRSARADRSWQYTLHVSP